MTNEMDIKELEREAAREADATYQRAETAVAAIAKEAGFETLESRKSDELDFHELAVWQLKELLIKAYYAGVNGE